MQTSLRFLRFPAFLCFAITIGTPALGQAIYATVSNGTNGGGKLIRISQSGETKTVIEGLNCPGGLAIDSKGNIYFEDASKDGKTSNIEKYSADGKLTTFVTGLPQGFQAITFDTCGCMFITNSGKISKVSQDGSIKQLSTAFDDAYGLTIDPLGNLYAASFTEGDQRSFVCQMDIKGNVLSKTDIKDLSDVTYSGQYVYATSTSDNEIERIDSKGNVSVFTTDSNTDYALTSDGSGKIYAADYQNEILSYDGEGNRKVITTLANGDKVSSLAFDQSDQSNSGGELGGGNSGKGSPPPAGPATAAVPEPTTFVTAFLGILCGAAMLRRR